LADILKLINNELFPSTPETLKIKLGIKKENIVKCKMCYMGYMKL